MNAKQYLDHHGKKKAEKLCKKVGTSYAYFSQIAYGHRRPSVEMAKRLAEADSALDVVSLLMAEKRKKDQVA